MDFFYSFVFSATKTPLLQNFAAKCVKNKDFVSIKLQLKIEQ